MKKTLKIGISLGDPNGIGTEVALRAAYDTRWPAHVQLVLIGSRTSALEQATSFGYPEPPPQGSRRKKVTLLDVSPGKGCRWTPGNITAAASRLAIKSIETAVEQCTSGQIDGMVTAPICKEGLAKAGFTMPGHTEFLAQLTGTKDFAMMLVGGPLRVVTLTRHLPLRQVAKHITKESIIQAVKLTDQALPLFGAKKRRIGVCALNPHAGDGGTIGDEEIRIISPAIKKLKREGLRVEGPVPADVIFYQAKRGDYDAVIAMYHDQGLGPLKMIAFDRGVNVTLGLPLVRTSPDHGTAFDIAGKGTASATSMAEAIKLAYFLASQRNPWLKM